MVVVIENYGSFSLRGTLLNMCGNEILSKNDIIYFFSRVKEVHITNYSFGFDSIENFMEHLEEEVSYMKELTGNNIVCYFQNKKLFTN